MCSVLFVWDGASVSAASSHRDEDDGLGRSNDRKPSATDNGVGPKAPLGT